MSIYRRLVGLFSSNAKGALAKASVAEIPPDVEPHDFQQPDQLRREGRLAEAERILEAFRNSTPDDPAVLRRLGLILYMQSRMAPAADVLRRVLLVAPDDPEALKFLCGCLSALGQDAEALEVARRAVAVSGSDSQLRNAFGAMLVKMGEVEQAIEHFYMALELNPADLTPLANLEVLAARFDAAGLQQHPPANILALRAHTISGLTARLEHQNLSIAEADLLCTLTNNHGETFAIACQIESRFKEREDLSVGLLVNLAIVAQYRGDINAVIDYYERVARQDEEFVEARYGLGRAYIAEGGSRWEKGWEMVSQTYRLLNPRNYPANIPQWTGQPIVNGRLFVHFDQGAGDALVGLRFLSRLADAGIDVLLWLPLSLGGLVGSLDARIETIVSQTRPDAVLHGCIYACGFFELVAPLGLSREQISDPPRLAAPEATARRWRDRLAALPGRKIAVATLGNPLRVDDWLRSVTFDHLAPLAEFEGVSWINVMVDDRSERTQLIDRFGMLDISGDLRDFGETAAALGAVDAVIACDCATAHLAGSLRLPLFFLHPTMLAWHWQIGEEMSPWWPTAHVYSASAPGVWGEAVAALQADLRQFLESPVRDR